VNCWTISQHESYALWKIYLGGSKAGVAIRTTISKLRNSINSVKQDFDEDIFIGKVQYSDFIDEPSNRFKIITTKNKFYDYENELRLIIINYPLSEGGIKVPYNISYGKFVQVNNEKLINEIYLSPFVGNWFVSVFINTIKKIAPYLCKNIRVSLIKDI